MIYFEQSAYFLYIYIIFLIIVCIIILFLIKLLYKLIIEIRENKKDSSSKSNMKEILLKEKWIFKILKYPIIWGTLIWTGSEQITLLFWIFSKHFYETHTDIILETLPAQEIWVLWMWPTYSLWIFIIAWYFIWLCFGNKMLRNIWILIYALWILFYLFGIFLYNWAITNWLEKFVMW